MNEENIENISSDAERQNSTLEKQPNDAEKYKQMAVNDINTINNLVQSGVMTQEQGQNLMNFVTQKAFEKYTSVLTPPQQDKMPEVDKTVQPQAMPDFFNRNGRIDVYDYLKNSNVDFDEDHSDENGNLDDSVENITTNGDGDQTGEELPDPNQTGAEFDKKSPSGDSSSSTEQLEEAPSTSTSGTGDETYEYEELIDQLIEQEAAQSSTETEGYQYTK